MIPRSASPPKTRLFPPLLLGALGLMGTAAHATTYQVTTLAETGSGSIRQAIDNVNLNKGTAPYFITFAPNLSGTIKLSGKVLTVVGNVTIDGPGFDELTIDGQNKEGVFSFNGQVTLKNLTIANGNSLSTGKRGGGIKNYGSLRVESCQLKNNTSNSGGGIYNRGTLVVRDSEFIDCDAFEGAGIFNATALGRTFVRNCLFESNGTEARTNTGGAIHNEGDLSVEDATIEDNVATVGGGIYNEMTAEEDDAAGGILDIKRSLFDANHALANAGALYVGINIPANVSNTDFTDNSSGGEREYRGGGAIDNEGYLFLERVSLEGNKASSGGAIYNSGLLFHRRGVLRRNEARSGLSQGGALFNFGGSYEGISLQFASNVAVDSKDLNVGSGGAIFGESLKLSSCLFDNNSAGETGGAIAGRAFNLSNCDFYYNTCYYGGGGAIFNAFNFANDVLTSTINQCRISSGQASFGGGIFNTGNLNLLNSLLDNNLATENGGGVENADLGGQDATRLPGILNMSRCALVENDSPVGKALSNDSLVAEGSAPTFAGTARISNSTFSNGPSSPGSMISNTSTLVLHSCTVKFEAGEDTDAPAAIDNLLEDGQTEAQLRVANTIVAGDGSTTNYVGFSGDRAISEGYNISSDDTGPSTSTDRLETDPNLTDSNFRNGVFYYSLRPGSPAINGGNPAVTDSKETDQRGPGFPRVRSGRLDVGSIEVQNDLPSAQAVKGPTGSAATFSNGVVPNPLRGQSNLNEFVTFSTLVTDADGSQDVSNIEFILGSGESELRMNYNRQNNRVNLRGGGKSVTETAGSSNILTVPSGALDASATKAVKVTNGVLVTWRLKITAPAKVIQNVRLQGRDLSGARSAAPSFGTWTFVPSNGQGLKSSGGSA